ncbi:Protein OS-9 [Sporothrix curviconia]|uniref:Endoplasmic reticulum lectin n=1 Tax=Sporothrix curviconia TaxID=1260050 RepID=A0ABP0BL79_9PEZI
MLGFQLVLLAGLQLCAARQPSFSIHDDLLAHPQFEVVFSDSYILEKDARLLLAAAVHREAADDEAYQSDSTTSQTDLANPAVESAAASGSGSSPGSNNAGNKAYGNAEDAADGSAQVSETFEIMNVPPSRYLCSVPVLAPPAPLSQTATELARAEEAREISRMSERGVDIVNTLEGECMYYVFGWWSYSFCYGKEIVQFHALTTKTGKPVKDPQSQEYVLGRMLGQEAAAKAAKGDVDVQEPLDGNTNGNSDSNSNSNEGKAATDPYNTELQIKGDQRYMVQRLGAGTICDLTGRERTVEIQYHCNPGGTSDRISWIKEVTTCAYLMEVRTPRLCEEAAFLPPKPTHAHPISCRLIVRSEEEASQWHQQKAIEAHAALKGAKTALTEEQQQQQQQQTDEDQSQNPNQNSIIVGGVEIGARKALGRGEDGQPPLKLEPPKYFGRDGAELAKGGRVIRVLARAKSKASGGDVEMLPNEELLKFDISHDQIKDLVGQLVESAKGRGWRLEAVEHPGVPTLEIRAILEPDDGDEQAHWDKTNPPKLNGDIEEKKNKAAGDKKDKKDSEDKDREDEKADVNDDANANAQGTHTVTEQVTVTVEKVETATEMPDGREGGDEGSEETFKKDEL